MEYLPDPCQDRNVDIEPFFHKPIATDILFPNGTSAPPDWEKLRTFFKGEGKVSKSDVLSIIGQATKMFAKEPNLMKVPEPLVIVGDIHGQYYDLCHLLDKTGSPSNFNYLFLGDYVDRGIYGFEVILLLFAIKLNFPENVFMLRGNHETKNMTQHFTFREEVCEKYDSEVYDEILGAFNSLPVSAVANN